MTTRLYRRTMRERKKHNQPYKPEYVPTMTAKEIKLNEKAKHNK